MSHPILYTLAVVPRVGSESEGTTFVGGEICQRCHQSDARRVDQLHLSLESYRGEHLVSTGRGLAVTPTLRAAIEAAALSGCSFRPIAITRAAKLAPETETPVLEQLVITGRAEAASSWWRRQGTCPLCKRAVWRMTPVTTSALFAAHKGEVAPPRTVYREKWNGDDFFYGDDPGPPFVTARVKDVLDAFSVPTIALHPARFVRDRRKWA